MRKIGKDFQTFFGNSPSHQSIKNWQTIEAENRITNVSMVKKVYNTIQAAIDDTPNGESLLLAEGVYTENIVLNKNISLTPAYMANVTIQASNSSNPVITINPNGNGSVIMGLIIKGGANSYGIYLNGTSNCYIISNNLKDNYRGISLLNSNNNMISSNVLMDNQIGVHLEYSNNNTIQNNAITNNYGGIYLDHSNDSILTGNDLSNNYYDGIYLDHSNNAFITENNLADNIYGINSQYSSATVQFNRIVGNIIYGLFSQNSTINANNNWWGSNNGPIVSTDIGSDICNTAGTVDSHLWLELNVNVSTTSSGGNTSITADLTHNNEGNDTSSGGHVPNRIPVNFTTDFGTVISTGYTIKGKAKTILNLGSTQNTTIITTASLDNQTASTTGTVGTGSVVLTITSTAIDNSTGQPLNITYILPLNNLVTWFSILWNNVGTFKEELKILVNGTVVIDRYFTNNAYNTWKNSYPVRVFDAINYVDRYSRLNRNMDASFWNYVISNYNLNSTELVFVQNHWPEFLEDLTFDMTYPGAVSPNITVVDPDNNTNVVNLNFTGNSIHRTSHLIYYSLEENGYEGVRSFAIATTKIDDNIFNYWLNQYSFYQPGAMKAAYGTFLNALIAEYIHDQIADAAANQFNITWSRTSPIIVSVGDDAYQTFLTLECDHSMGMTVVGTANNMWKFNYLCSSSISPIEYVIMDNLKQPQIVSTAPRAISSITQDLINLYLNNNTSLEGFIQDGYIIIKAVNSNDNFIVIDPETGIVRDINTITNYYGAYCFHDPLTQSAYELGENLVQGIEHFNWRRVAGIAGVGLGIFGVITSGASIYGTAGLDSPIAIPVLVLSISDITVASKDLMENWNEPWFY